MDRAQREDSGHPRRRYRPWRHHGGAPAGARMYRSRTRRACGSTTSRLDQKRRTGSAGISIVSREDAVTRYHVAVDAKNEIDRDFVIMAQCYARNAVNGGMG